MNKYTEKDLFDFMDARKPVKVTSTDGITFSGMCWAYSAAYNDAAEERNEASLEVENIVFYISEIAEIEYL